MTDTLTAFFAKPRTLYDEITRSHPSLMRGRVWCTRCDAWKDIDAAKCLEEGWPRCHDDRLATRAQGGGEGARSPRCWGMNGNNGERP